MVAVKRIHLIGMVDSKARSDCLREIDLLKVNVTLFPVLKPDRFRAS